MNPKRLEAIEAEAQSWFDSGKAPAVIVLAIKDLVAEVRQLYRDNILLLGEADRLRTALGDVLVVVNASTENTAAECHVRVIATQALHGKGDRVTLAK